MNPINNINDRNNDRMTPNERTDEERLIQAVKSARRRRKKKNRSTLMLSLFSVAVLAAVGFTIASLVGRNVVFDSNAAENSSDEQAVFSTAPVIPLSENEEMRGVWVASVININYPSAPALSADELRAELDDIVKNTLEAGLNTIFFQVRPTADSLYPSQIFPYSKYISGIQGKAPDENFDSLAYLLEKAGQNGLSVHAWVNPFRVTMYSSDEAGLCPEHPAVLHPEYTVKYADGKTYFNPGLPEVRTLIIEGVKELTTNYPTLAGIHFDDYFYPYPKDGAEFDDQAAYELYGNGVEKDAWRRENVNTLIRDTYNAVKAIRPDLEFGVSPFGIWANSGSDTPERGSVSSGLEAYSSLYCDALAWAKGGYVDYLIPQLYWSFATKAAPFDNMARWWNAALDGSGVKYYIGHAAYKVADYAENEMGIQVEFARNLLCYRGSVFYGYEDIKNNTNGLKDKLASLYQTAVVYPDPEEGTLELLQPTSDTLSDAAVNLVGRSDPRYPLTVEGQKVSRTKSGLFAYYTSLSSNERTIRMEQNGVEKVHTFQLNNKRAATTKPSSFSKMEIVDVSPSTETWIQNGDTIKITCAAPAGSTVTATLGGLSVTLKTDTKPSSTQYTKAIYTGEMTPTAAAPAGGTTVLGTLLVAATLGNETVSAQGGAIRQMGEGARVYAEVINHYSYLKTSPTSSFYDDYTPASIGMRDYITGLTNGYYHLLFGGYVAAENVRTIEGVELNHNKILAVDVAVNGTDTINNKNNFTDVSFTCLENVPVNAVASAGMITFTFYHTDETLLPLPTIAANPLVSAITAASVSEDTLAYTIHLKNEYNAYGYDVLYQSGKIIVRLNNPQRLSDDPSRPLAGKTIVVDAGHGGTDGGAAGCGKTNEAMLNLDIALHLRNKLEALGANVLMTRSDDTTHSLEERMEFLNEAHPDLAISVHQNSVPSTSNAQKARGYLGLYCTEAGKLLAKTVSATVSAELNRYERPFAYQKLAVARNHRFPSTLCEMCFISNTEEYEWSITPGNTERSAAALADGILAYYRAQEVYLAY